MTAKRLFLLTFALAGMAITLTVLLFVQGNRLLVEKAPLIEASEEIKVNGTLAHLWFEEVLSGDTTQSIQEVWYYLEIADWYALALLEGGESIKGSYKPLKDPELRAILKSMRETLADFHEKAELRYRFKSISSPGSDIDIRSDKMFMEFIRKADDVQRAVKNHLETGISSYQIISLTLILISIIIAVYLNSTLYRIEKHREGLFRSLSHANESIEAKNRQLHTQAHYDSLTNLPNRVLFIDRLGKTILNADRLDMAFSVLFIDLDHFKSVNDQYGHEVGDKLLQNVAKRINHCIRVSDTAARISGDEFIVVLEHLNDVSKAMNTANKIANNLIKSLQQPFKIGDVSVTISASIGVSINPEDSADRDALIRYADNAMYHAKALGKNNFQFYSEELNRISMSQLETERDLNEAITKDEFELHYLPKWHLATGEISGVEALVRWKHPIKGMIYPDSFIPVAESSGLIRKMDLLVAKKAIEQNSVWLKQGVDIGLMCINISAKSIKNHEFYEQLKRVIIESEIPAERLEIEITESVLVENDQFAQTIFKELSQLGIRIALDDFGTGFSSLSYLKDFDFHTLKIDRSFVSDYQDNHASKVLLKHIVQIGNELGLDVVAEGVENIQQQRDLMMFGCKIGQGYFKTPPLPAKPLIEKLFSERVDNVVPLCAV
ncbi:EAL domain-containing protein [Vibrio hannami]|uniref:putative bifunctional diguanylate cyclase/phosphodiesterase n=1 Tax=Vibrio hannami TaxID=2717094 RepID=UPI00240F41D3|nr:EAL domain-containing protein [Vibrio hannami]MDG3085390.1 EAL domain-containing protein [Vibrio hannami]